MIFGFGKNWGGEKSTVKIVDAEFDVGGEVPPGYSTTTGGERGSEAVWEAGLSVLQAERQLAKILSPVNQPAGRPVLSAKEVIVGSLRLESTATSNIRFLPMCYSSHIEMYSM